MKAPIVDPNGCLCLGERVIPEALIEQWTADSEVPVG